MEKKRFKLYKSGKQWVISAIATFAITTGVLFSTSVAQADEQESDTTPQTEEVLPSSNVKSTELQADSSTEVNNTSAVAPTAQQENVQNGWQKNDQGQLVYYQDGDVLSGRQYLNLPTIPDINVHGDTNWYLVDNGVAQSGVQQWAGSYYYFDPVTYLRVDNDYRQAQWGDWYLFGNDGRILTGVQQWAGTYYYFDPTTYLRVDNDYRQSQWGLWYMFGPDGQIATKVYQWAGTYYYFDSTTYLRVDNDYRQSQWGDWYMFGPDGRIVTGAWQWYGKEYYFDPVTYLKVTNNWADGNYYGYDGTKIDGFNYKNATYLVNSVLHKTDANGNIINNFDESAYPNLGKISFIGDLTGITKDDKKKVQAKITLTDGTVVNAWATIKWQGNSSLAWPKKGYRVKLFKDEALTKKYKLELPGTGFKTNSFNLKGSFNEPTMGLNIVNARLYSEITKSRLNLTESIVNDMPNYGQVSGLPVELGINGLDQGLYVLETYHEDKVYNLDDKKTDNIALSANYHAPVTAFDAKVTVADLQDTIFDNISPERPDDSVVRNFSELYDIANSEDNNYNELENKYLDVPAAIDYLAFSFAINNSDGLRKNITYVSKNNSKWTIIPYDLDTTWNSNWDNSSQDIWRNFEDSLHESGNKLLLTFYAHHKQDIINRYQKLRQNVLSTANVIAKFNQWFASIGDNAYQHNYDLWNGLDNGNYVIPTNVNQVDFAQMIAQRLSSVDKYWNLKN